MAVFEAADIRKRHIGTKLKKTVARMGLEEANTLIYMDSMEIGTSILLFRKS